MPKKQNKSVDASKKLKKATNELYKSTEKLLKVILSIGNGNSIDDSAKELYHYKMEVIFNCLEHIYKQTHKSGENLDEEKSEPESE